MDKTDIMIIVPLNDAKVHKALVGYMKDHRVMERAIELADKLCDDCSDILNAKSLELSHKADALTDVLAIECPVCKPKRKFYTTLNASEYANGCCGSCKTMIVPEGGLE